MQQFNFATLVDGEEIMAFRDSVYLYGRETLIKSKLEERYPKISSHMVREVVEHIKRRTFAKRGDFDTEPRVASRKDIKDNGHK